MQQNADTSKESVSGDLKPCRSPYCECAPGNCRNPERYDARGEALLAEQPLRHDPVRVAADVRAACDKLRRTPTPLKDMIPMMQRAAGALGQTKEAKELLAACETLGRTSMALADLIPLMQRSADALDASSSQKGCC